MKVQFTSRIESDLMDKIKLIAAKEMRSTNNTIEFLLSSGVEQYMFGVSIKTNLIDGITEALEGDDH